MIWKEVLAIKNSTNLNFKLPEYTDNVDIEQINGNFTTIDSMFEGGTLKDENIPATVARAADVPTTEDFSDLTDSISAVSNAVKTVEENLENHSNDLTTHLSESEKNILVNKGVILSTQTIVDSETNMSYTSPYITTMSGGENMAVDVREAINVYSKSQTYSKTELDTKFASIVTDIFSLGTTAPENTKLLWIDTTAVTGGLKYYNGTEWVHVPVAYN